MAVMVDAGEVPTAEPSGTLVMAVDIALCELQVSVSDIADSVDKALRRRARDQT